MTTESSATIKIDPARVLGPVDPAIYGGFIEHLGRCIYGGVFDEGSRLSDANGFRRDVMQAIHELGVTCLRWPGGLFASGYHWTDGIGPRDARPRRLELAWRAEEPNRFGTDEFVDYCRCVGAEPIICVNIGTGTLDEAAGWVEYCNGTGDTFWANRRRAHGFPQPHGVRYWCLGNEAYNRQAIGTLNADDYVKKATEFAKVMRMADPTIKLISSGLNGWSRWDRSVLEGLAPLIDFHSIHLYTGSPDYYSNVFAPHLAERALRACSGMIEAVRYQHDVRHPIYIAYDEWNVWFRAGNPPWEQWTDVEGGLEERYTLSDALAVATFLNVFIRHCATVRMANIAQLVNVLAPIMTSADALVRQTTFHPFQLFARHMRGDAIDAYVECESLSLRPEDETSPWPHRVAELGPFPVLDVAATRSSEGIAVAVVNRDLTRDVTATIRGVRGAGMAYELNAHSVDCSNWFDAPNDVQVRERPVASDLCTFPAHSLTVLSLGRS